MWIGSGAGMMDEFGGCGSSADLHEKSKGRDGEGNGTGRALTV